MPQLNGFEYSQDTPYGEATVSIQRNTESDDSRYTVEIKIEGLDMPLSNTANQMVDAYDPYHFDDQVNTDDLGKAVNAFHDICDTLDTSYNELGDIMRDGLKDAIGKDMEQNPEAYRDFLGQGVLEKYEAGVNAPAETEGTTLEDAMENRLIREYHDSDDFHEAVSEATDKYIDNMEESHKEDIEAKQEDNEEYPGTRGSIYEAINDADETGNGKFEIGNGTEVTLARGDDNQGEWRVSIDTYHEDPRTPNGGYWEGESSYYDSFEEASDAFEDSAINELDKQFEPQDEPDVDRNGSGFVDNSDNDEATYSDHVVDEEIVQEPDGRTVDVSVYERPDGDGYDVESHPVLADGTVLYGIDMSHENFEDKEDAESSMCDTADKLEIDGDADAYDEATENSAYDIEDFEVPEADMADQDNNDFNDENDRIDSDSSGIDTDDDNRNEWDPDDDVDDWDSIE